MCSYIHPQPPVFRFFSSCFHRGRNKEVKPCDHVSHEERWFNQTSIPWCWISFASLRGRDKNKDKKQKKTNAFVLVKKKKTFACFVMHHPERTGQVRGRQDQDVLTGDMDKNKQPRADVRSSFWKQTNKKKQRTLRRSIPMKMWLNVTTIAYLSLMVWVISKTSGGWGGKQHKEATEPITILITLLIITALLPP